MARFVLRTEPPNPEREPRDQPVMGYLAVGFGVASIFVSGLVFVPLSLLCSIAALFMGQVTWGVFGFLLAAVGFVTTPFFLLVVGLTALYELMRHFYDTIGVPTWPGTTEV